MKKFVSRFKGKLVKMIKDSGGKFDHYSISPKIRQIFLHWGYEFKKEDLLQFFLIKVFFFYSCIKYDLWSIEQVRNIAESKEKLFWKGNCWVLFTEQRSHY